MGVRTGSRRQLAYWVAAPIVVVDLSITALSRPSISVRPDSAVASTSRVPPAKLVLGMTTPAAALVLVRQVAVLAAVRLPRSSAVRARTRAAEPLPRPDCCFLRACA